MKVAERIQPIATGANIGNRKKDCTVRALANAADIPYYLAEEELRAYGREHNKGAHFPAFNTAYKKYGFEVEGVYGTTKMSKHYSLQTNKPARKGMSLKTALQIFNDGTYIFITAAGKHAVAAIDGELIDTFASKAHESVVLVYRKV